MRTLFRLLSLVVLIFPSTTALAAEEVTVAEVLAESPELSGVEVAVEGELVGDYGFRSDGSMWTQLNGDIYAIEPSRESESPAGSNVGIGVRIPSDLAEGLDHPGGYHHRGPLVRLTGVWRYDDPARQGETYLDVAVLELIEPGRELDEDIVWWTVIAGSGLLAAAGVLWFRRPKPDGTS